MGNTGEKKMVTEITFGSSKITDRKLVGTKNFGQWKRTLRRFVISADLEDHLTGHAPPKSDGEARKKWLIDDNKLFNQIQNTLDPTVDDVVTHCETVKELWDYLELLFASKQDLSYVHNLLLKIYRADQKGRTLFQYYNEVKQAFEEQRSLFPITADVRQMQEQQEQLVTQCFLAGLGPEYDVACTQLLSGEKIPPFFEVYARLLRVCKDGNDPPGTVAAESVALLSNVANPTRIFKSVNSGNL